MEEGGGGYLCNPKNIKSARKEYFEIFMFMTFRFFLFYLCIGKKLILMIIDFMYFLYFCIQSFGDRVKFHDVI